MSTSFRFPVVALAVSVLLGVTALTTPAAHAQQNKTSVFSKLPTTQQPNAQQKRRLRMDCPNRF